MRLVNTRTRVIKLAVTLPLVALVTACGGSSSGGGGGTMSPINNPRDGWVKIQPDDDTTWKICDKGRLVYEYDTGHSGGIYVISDAPECGSGTTYPTPGTTP